MGAPPPESWYRILTRTAAQIRESHGVPDQATEDRMVRVFRAALRPRRKAGRKPTHETQRAAEMWIAGMEEFHARGKRPSLRLYQRQLWQRIYLEVFSDFARMDKLDRQYRTGTLRRNVKAFLSGRGANGPARLMSPHERARQNV